MNRTLTKSQLDTIAKVCCEIGKDGYSVNSVNVEHSYSITNPIMAYQIITEHPKYKSKWLRLNDNLSRIT